MSFLSNKCVTGGSSQHLFSSGDGAHERRCGKTAGPTLKSVVIDVSDCSDALAEVRIEGVVATQNSGFLHHPLKTATGSTTVDM